MKSSEKKDINFGQFIFKTYDCERKSNLEGILKTSDGHFIPFVVQDVHIRPEILEDNRIILMCYEITNKDVGDGL